MNISKSSNASANDIKSSFSPPSPSKQTLKTGSIEKSLASNHCSWSLKTPEKSNDFPKRIRNKGVALSVKEVKKMAECLNVSKKNSSDVARGRKGSCAEKTIATPMINRSRREKSSTTLPEEYSILGQFFDSLVSSIRLLLMKGSMTLLTNICPKIETLTDRRFSCAHLGQIKHIIPEAIQIKKIFHHDEKTLCMKPDLQITLQPDVFENDKTKKSGNKYSILRNVFHERLLQLFETHPEGDGIPEEPLPEPFNQKKLNFPSHMDKAIDSTIPTCKFMSQSPMRGDLIKPSHLPSSFQRQFSLKVPISESEKLSLIAPSQVKPVGPGSSTITRSLACEPSPSPVPSFSSLLTDFRGETIDSRRVVNVETILGNSDNCFSPEKSKVKSTPSRQILTPSKLMTVTPELQTPKRSRIMSPDDDILMSQRSLKRPFSSRALDFSSPEKKMKCESSLDADIIKFLPEKILQSVYEKQNKAMEDRDLKVNEANRRQLMITCLPKLLDIIQLIFQSEKRSVLAKQELLNKIIASHTDITDIKEVEEQVQLLLELIPEYISEKMSLSGDVLFCINDRSNHGAIRAKLAQAT